jgi:hypothetical protein
MREPIGGKPKGAIKVKVILLDGRGTILVPIKRSRRSTVSSLRHVLRVKIECIRWDPKDGELCLSRAKPEETLVEVRSGSDVQIDRQTWV